MRKIYVLEHFDFTAEQMNRLKSLGELLYYQKANEEVLESVFKNYVR